MEFAPEINIFVGPNGTGKTHLMKCLYGTQNYFVFSQRDDLTPSPFRKLFQINQTSEIIRYGSQECDIELAINGFKLNLNISNSGDSKSNWGMINFDRAIFIPALNMISHTKKFIPTYDEYQIDFDLTHRDIVSLLFSPEKRIPSEHASKIMNVLESIMGGKLEEEGERFYLESARGRHPMPLVADGMRKIATLYQLVKNGWLEPGAVLFWDEPETHLSPILMDEVIQVLLELSRSGVQIFLATHNYIILKEFDLQATEEDSVRYFSFSLNENNAAQVSWTDDYSQIGPNPISDQLDYIYDRELKRSLGPRGK